MVRKHQPVYKEIAAQLRQQIQTSVYRPGDQLPTEADLSHRFDVHRHTVRRALEILRQEGLITIIQGYGSFVAQPLVHLSLNDLLWFHEVLQQQGFQVREETVSEIEVAADRDLAMDLQVDACQLITKLERLVFADGQPLMLETCFIPKQYGGRCLGCGSPHLTPLELVRDLHQTSSALHTTQITTQFAQTRDVELLGVGRKSQILVIQSTFVNPEQQIVARCIKRSRGDRVQLMLTHAQGVA